MDQTLGFLRETVSNYTDEQQLAISIYKKIESKEFSNEENFVRSLTEEEVSFLNNILPDEINYAMEEQDYKRVHELNDVYELLL